MALGDCDETGVGRELPAGWQLAPVETLAQITTGGRNTQDRVSDGKYPFFVRSQVVERINSYSYDGEAVLTAGDGVGTGKVFHYMNGKFDCHQRVYRISEFASRINGYFFFLYFSNFFYSRIMQMTAKSSVDSVRREMIARMLIPVPPLPEQQAVATALSDADAYIESLEQLITKKRQIKQGVMQELLTGKRRLPGFEGRWQRQPLGSLLRICHGRNQKLVESDAGEFPILASGGQIGWATEPLWTRPSVLIGRKGTIDKPQFMDTPFWTVDTLYYSDVFEPNDAKFLFYRFCLIDWRRYNEASGVPSLSAKTIHEIEIDCPDPTEQKSISSLLSDLDQELDQIKAKLSKARHLKQAMMQQLLTGKIRLV